MVIGKREQIVIGSITAIALIAVLHLVIFAPSALSFKKNKSERDGMVGTIKGLRTIRNEQTLVDFDAKTKKFMASLLKGAGKLELEQPEPFVVPPLDKIDAPPAVAGDPPDKAKKAKQKEMAKAKSGPATDLIMAEIGKIRASMANKSSATKLSFLGTANIRYGWMIPDQLPPTMAGGVLWDKLKKIAEFKTALNNSPKNTAPYYQVENVYKQALMEIGLNKDISESRAIFGAFVPTIQRLCYVDMILQRMKASPPPPIPGVNLTREGLIDYLSVELDFDPIAELEESKAYFLYQELSGLNSLISVAQSTGIKDITSVQLRGYGFVREQMLPDMPPENIPTDISRLGDDETDDPKVWATADMTYTEMIDPLTGLPIDPTLATDPSMAAGGAAGAPGAAGAGGVLDPSMMGMPTSALDQGPAKSKPNEKDLGFSVPIRVTFVAPNAAGITYLYELLRQRPLAELHRLVMRSTSTFSPQLTVAPNPASNDVEITATILFIPKLFKIQDVLNTAIQDILGSGTQTGAVPPPTPPAG